MAAPISGKVKSATLASAIAGLIAAYLLKGMDPTIIEAVLTPVLTAAGTFAAGWLARHTPKDRQ